MKKYNRKVAGYWKKWLADNKVELDLNRANVTLNNGNDKLGRMIYTLDFPAGAVSIGGVCSQTCDDCYALRGRSNYKNVKKSRAKNILMYMTNKARFLQSLREQIKKHRKLEFIRIFSSGEWSIEFARDIRNIIKEFPNIFFYSYTKEEDVRKWWKEHPLQNFNMIDSMTDDGLINYGTLEYIKMLQKDYGYAICRCGLTDEDQHGICSRCKLCMKTKKVAFLKSTNKGYVK